MKKRRKLIVAIATVCLAVFAVLGMAMATSWITNGKLDKGLTIGKPISIGLTDVGTKYYDETGAEVSASTLLPGYHADVTVNYTIEIHDTEKYQIKLTDNSSTADWAYWSLFVVTTADAGETETAVTLDEAGCVVINNLTAGGSVKLRFYFDKGKTPADATAGTSEANKIMNVTLTLEEMA